MEEEAKSSEPPRWLILDRFVHRSSRDVLQEDDVTASTTSYTCTGRPIRASLRLAGSPAVSRLYLHWPDRREFPGMREPYVIAAHRRSILFKAKIPLEDDMTRDDTFYFPVDLFVYSAFSSPPSLHRLPPCFTGGISAPEEDRFFAPYRNRQQRPMLESCMGVLCHGGGDDDHGEFTVADLTGFTFPEAELCLLHHHGSRKNEDSAVQWRVQKVRFTMEPDVYYSWRTDAVVPIDGSFLCCVDYYKGMLIVDVLLANDESRQDQLQFSYIPLPEEALRSRRQYPEGDGHEPSRCVCVTATGMLKLVCIANNGEAGRLRRSAFTVTSWTLFDMHQGWSWHKDGTMEADEFFGLYGCDRSLPRVKPSYPLVSLVHHDTICFLLEEDRDTFWIIEVDLKNKVLRSSARYIKKRKRKKREDAPLTWSAGTSLMATPLSPVTSPLTLSLDARCLHIATS